MFIHGLFVLVDAAFNNMLIKYFFDGFFYANQIISFKKIIKRKKNKFNFIIFSFRFRKVILYLTKIFLHSKSVFISQENSLIWNEKQYILKKTLFNKYFDAGYSHIQFFLPRKCECCFSNRTFIKYRKRLKSKFFYN